MTRDEARAHWSASGLTYEELTSDNLKALRSEVNQSMIRSGLIDDTFRAKQRFKTHSGATGFWADLRCRSFYFEDRQAITFEENGFVGFAGWADDENVQPILEGFCHWLKNVSKTAIAA